MIVNLVAGLPSVPSPAKEAMLTSEARGKLDIDRGRGSVLSEPKPVGDRVVSMASFHGVEVTLIWSVTAVGEQSVKALIRANAKLVPSAVWRDPVKLYVDV